MKDKDEIPMILAGNKADLTKPSLSNKKKEASKTWRNNQACRSLLAGTYKQSTKQAHKTKQQAQHGFLVFKN